MSLDGLFARLSRWVDDGAMGERRGLREAGNEAGDGRERERGDGTGEVQGTTAEPGRGERIIGRTTTLRGLLAGTFSGGNDGNGRQGGLAPNAQLRLSITTPMDVTSGMGAERNAEEEREVVREGRNTDNVRAQSATGEGGLEEAENGIISRRGTHHETLYGAQNIDMGVAREAQMHRQESMISSIDVRQVARSLGSALPFLAMVLVVFVWHHIKAITLIGIGTLVLHRCNRIVAKQATRKSQASRWWTLLGCAVVALSSAGLELHYGFKEDQLHHVFRLQWRASSKTYEFWSVVFDVYLLDTAIRLVSIALNAGFVAIAPVGNTAKIRRMGGILTAMAYVADVPRTVAPIPFWLQYFALSGLPSFFSWFLSGMYVVLKGFRLMEKVSLALQAVRQWRGMSYGLIATKDELAATPVCAICHEEMKLNAGGNLDVADSDEEVDSSTQHFSFRLLD